MSTIVKLGTITQHNTMADEEINGDVDDIQNDMDKTQKKAAKHDSGVADLEKVTDYAEEKEISSQDISGVSTRIFLKYLFFL